MSYVLRRNEDGAFVRPPGSRGSYTHNLRLAARWATKEAAEKEACGNETAWPVEHCLGRKLG